MAERAVGTTLIVVDAPGFDLLLGIRDRRELVDVQTLVSQAPVVRLDKGVFDGFSRANEVELYAALSGAPFECTVSTVCSQQPTRYPDAGESKTMPTITFDVPEGALSALRLSPTEFVKEMRVAAALLWYSHGELSQSKAAEIAGTSRAEFIDELAHRRIPVVQVTAEELQDEIHRE